MVNVRYNISPCTRDEVQAFITRINAAEYAPRNTVLADSRSHYDRYSFLRDDSKIAVVYDTTAHVISITAPQNYADDLLAVFAPNDKAVKRSTVPAQGTKVNNPASDNMAGQKSSGNSNSNSDSSSTRYRVFEKPKEPIRTAPTVIATAKGAEMYSDEICPPQRVIKRARAETSSDVGLNDRRSDRVAFDFHDEIAPPQIVRRNGNKSNNENKNTSYNKQRTFIQPDTATATTKPQITTEQSAKDDKAQAQSSRRVDRSKPQQQQQVGVEVSARATRHAGGVHRATISFGDDDYSPRTVRQTPSLRSGTGLYADISNAANAPTDNVSAQSSGGDSQQKRGRGRPPKTSAPQNNDSVNTGAGASHEDKRLRRRIPTAYDFLPQQARDDLSGGLRNFEQTKLNMTDYSGLLMQPYRGLEAFVLDLQRAEGIRVKMIGQAFDKDENGNYVLKSGYMQKIGSVVYGEVMVALYTEYYSRRNYFAHTDNSEDGSVPRSIPDRAIAKGMFDNLLKVIEYNARKLKEIGFGMKRDESGK